MTQITAMRALKIVTACALLSGATVVLITVVTWPSWNPIQAASNMSEVLGIPVDPSELTPPSNTVNYAWLGTGIVLVLFGAVSLLATLHAAAVRPLAVATAGREAGLKAQTAEER